MTCLVEHVDGIACINCKRADQVYTGHGAVRFCAHCSISWDLTEDGNSLDLQKKTVILSDEQDGEDGELPGDMIERMGALIGSVDTIFAFERRMGGVMAIPEALFTEDQDERQIKALDQKAADQVWRSLVSSLSPVMQLVHEAMRMEKEDTKAMADELFKARKAEFNDAISDYVAQTGCAGTGNLSTTVELKFFRDDSNRDARDIANTYNLNLAKTIQEIRLASPKANRNTYTKALREWEAGRRIWKATQIALNTTLTARSQALASFAFHNDLQPRVELLPKLAKEPICQGWVNRGKVAFQIAANNPSPYHLNCIHFWEPDFTGISGDCTDLWVG